MARRYVYHNFGVGLEDIRIADELKENLFESNDSNLPLFSKLGGLTYKGFDGVNVALVIMRRTWCAAFTRLSKAFCRSKTMPG